MRKYISEGNLQLVVICSFVIIWRLLHYISLYLGDRFLQPRQDYLGAIPWANFDGMHYLSIAKDNYFTFEQVFFPLFPFTISGLGRILQDNFVLAGIVVMYTSLLLLIFLFWKVLRLDYSRIQSRWGIVFLLSFPTAYFFGSLYTESLFLACVLASFYFVRRKQYFLAGIFGFLASITRVVGIFLLPALLWEIYVQKRKVGKEEIIKAALPLMLIPGGLLTYMFYLWRAYGDPLLFIHAQIAFGAGRSSSTIVLLPQVLWRYFKIFITVPWGRSDYWLAAFEVILFLGVGVLLYVAIKQRIRTSYIIFSLFCLLFPPLSGTLSSIPRYVLVCFVIYIVFALQKSIVIRIGLLVIFMIIQLVLAALFLRGYFIA